MSNLGETESFDSYVEFVVEAIVPPPGESRVDLAALRSKPPERTAADLMAAAYKVAKSITNSSDPAEATELFQAMLQAALAEGQRRDTTPPAGAE